MLDEVKQREEEDPDDIDEVPVETAVLNGRVVFARELALDGLDRDPVEIICDPSTPLRTSFEF